MTQNLNPERLKASIENADCRLESSRKRVHETAALLNTITSATKHVPAGIREPVRDAAVEAIGEFCQACSEYVLAVAHRRSLLKGQAAA